MTAGARNLYPHLEDCLECYGWDAINEALAELRKEHGPKPLNNHKQKRYGQLMRKETELLPEEIAEGWHFCPEFDYLLVGPGMEEFVICDCDLPIHHNREN